MSVFYSTSEELEDLISNNDYDNLLIKLSKTTECNEHNLLEILPLLLEKIGDYKHYEKAKQCGELIISKMNPFAMKAYMSILYEGLSSLKWQIKKASLVLLGSFAKHQKKLLNLIYLI